MQNAPVATTIPLIIPHRVELGLGGRLIAALVAAACLGVLLVAAKLDPLPAGHGTHTQLGLPACGWAVALGRPCPTCGMTTAFALAVRGRFVASFLAQPMGFVLAVATAAAFWAGLYISLTGSQLGRVFARMVTTRVLWVAAGLAGAAWAYKWVTWVGS
jgi:hypothetical protein